MIHTYAEKQKIAKELDADELLRLFLVYHDNYNPLDQDHDDTYCILKAETLKRLRVGSTKEGN